jgi:hypothetical protein
VTATINSNALEHLKGAFRRAEPVLFTGAGFSVGATDREGRPIPLPGDLRDEIYELVYPDDTDPTDRGSLQDTFAVARSRAEQELSELLLARLAVDPQSIRDSHRTWLEMPWRRAYTVNIDDLEQAVAVRFDMPRPMRVVSALNSGIPTLDDNALTFIHLNGTLDDVPNVTFSERQYGERQALGRDASYEQLLIDLVDSPVIFVGTTLSEPPLWQHIALRRQVLGRDDFRQRAYLVTPALSRARQDLLSSFKVEWIPATADQFAAEVLHSLSEERARGMARVRARSALSDRYAELEPVGDLIARAGDEPGESEYLLGAEPTWADIAAGRAVARDFESTAALRQRSGCVVVHGTAGAGTTTTLMRAARRMAADGREVLWVDLRGALDGNRLIREIKRRSGEFVVVLDNADLLGSMATRLLDEVHSTRRRILLLLGLRTILKRRLPKPDRFTTGWLSELAVPHLVKSDIDRLIAALERDGKLGRLTNMSYKERVREFEERARKQLLVAMIGVTAGKDLRRRPRASSASFQTLKSDSTACWQLAR